MYVGDIYMYVFVYNQNSMLDKKYLILFRVHVGTYKQAEGGAEAKCLPSLSAICTAAFLGLRAILESRVVVLSRLTLKNSVSSVMLSLLIATLAHFRVSQELNIKSRVSSS